MNALGFDMSDGAILLYSMCFADLWAVQINWASLR